MKTQFIDFQIKELKLIEQNRPSNELELAICKKADELVNEPGVIMNILDLYVALSIYKLSVQTSSITGLFHGTRLDDFIQVDLFKEGPHNGIRIYVVGQPNTAIIL